MADDDETKKSIPLPLMQVLPIPVRKRVIALKKLQYETLKLEADFFVAVHKLECKYNDRFSHLNEERRDIVKGVVEPKSTDCVSDLPGCQEEDFLDDELVHEFRAKLTVTKLIENGQQGIPEFWLTIFKNVALLNDMIQTHDEPILKYLIDINVILHDEPMGFVLEFSFAPNPYFSNTLLTKEYEMKCSPDENDPWSFEGPEIYKCKGCSIDWHKSMNVTLKTVRKRQRHKSRGAVRTIVKTVQNDSFFNFFNPPVVPEDGIIDEETQVLLTSDFEIGHYVKEKIIPHAVLYYTGEALEDEDYEEEGESSETNEESDAENDYDEEEEESDENGSEEGGGEEEREQKPPPKNKNKNKSKNQTQECAQQ